MPPSHDPDDSGANRTENAPKRGRPGPKRPPLTAKQQALAAEHVPLARSIARYLKWAHPLHRDDLDAVAQFSLVQAAQSFDPTRGVKFATFARHRIKGGLQDFLRWVAPLGYRRDPDSAPLISSATAYDSLVHGVEEQGTVLGPEPDDPVGQDLDAVDFVEHWLKKLPDRHAAACRVVYLEGKSQAQAAKVVGCSNNRVSYLLQESRELIAAAMARAEADQAVGAKSLRKPPKTRFFS